MKAYFGYIRVSTTKQGEHGVSLPEQREAISQYAARNGLTVTQWFEEQQTAAKRGRPVFARMLALLKRRYVLGVIIHKIDRSARNLRDWADLGELIDQGVEVHFANESLDLHSRGGRLSADIQAVVAADYIRNLKEELRKGFYGRLKQGFFPMRAPIGYLDRGGGKAKEPDPTYGPLVRRAFELYSTGRFSLQTLLLELTRLGLRNRYGNRLSINGLSVLLRNPFYFGLIRITKTSEVFDGGHAPLITRSLFLRVQDILQGRISHRPTKHSFVYRRLFRCAACGRAAIGERRKGHVYYRCHMPACRGTTLREEAIDEAVRLALQPLCFSEAEKTYIAETLLPSFKTTWTEDKDRLIRSLKLSLQHLTGRLNRLTDAYLEGVIDKDTHETRKTSLLEEKRDIEDRLAATERGSLSVPDHLIRFLGLAKDAYQRYVSMTDDEKRELLETVTSDLRIDGKRILLTRHPAFEALARRCSVTVGGPNRDEARTWAELLPQFVAMIENKVLVLPEKKTAEYLVNAA